MLGGLAGLHAHPRQQRVQEPRDGHTFTLDLEPSGKLTDLSVGPASAPISSQSCSAKPALGAPGR